MKIKTDGFGRLVFNLFNCIILGGLVIFTLYPFIFVAAASFSDSTFILRGDVGVIPKGFNLDAYKAVLKYPLIVSAYRNTILYTVVGTAVNLMLTAIGAFPLSRARFYGRKFFTFFIVFTMLFSAGMIPTFLVVKSLGLYNTFWAMIVPSAISSWNLIVMRTFFQQIPVELDESATIDGCNDIQILFKIILPLSTASLMTIGLFYAVAHWNAFFSALIYLNDRKRYPLQMILRQIVLMNESRDLMEGVESRNLATFSESIKYATIMVATIPILTVYPFIQKYFVKGVMIGAVKG